MPAFDIFTQLPLFKEIEKIELLELIPKVSLDFEHVEAGNPLFEAGSPVRGLTFLLKGEAQTDGPVGQVRFLAPCLVGWKNVFGTLRQHERAVQALTACDFLTLDRRSLLFLFRNAPGFLEKYLDFNADS